MKKNTRKFEKTMREIIKCVIDKQPLTEHCTNNSEQLCEITYSRSEAGNAFFDLSEPFIRYKGIEFLENKHPEFKSNAQLFLSIFSTVVSVLALIVSFLSKYIDIQTVLNQYF